MYSKEPMKSYSSQSAVNIFVGGFSWEIKYASLFVNWWWRDSASAEGMSSFPFSKVGKTLNLRILRDSKTKICSFLVYWGKEAREEEVTSLTLQQFHSQSAPSPLEFLVAFHLLTSAWWCPAPESLVALFSKQQLWKQADCFICYSSS